MKVGIVGAGAAGLSAAWRLVKQGHQVEVFERAPFLGGQASTFDVGGARLERGYHHLFVSDRYMVDLIHELGLGQKLQWIESKVGLFCQGRIWDWVTPTDLLRFKPLSLPDRVRLGLVTLYLQKTSNWRKYEGVTAADWLTRRVGRSAYEKVWEPLLRGKFGQQYDQVGMTWLWGKIYLRVASRKGVFSRERLGYPTGSFGEVFDTLGQRITERGGRIHLSTAVKRIVVEDGRAKGLEVEVSPGQSEVRSYDAVIATAPSFVFTKLAPPLPQAYADKLSGVTYLAAVLAILTLDRPLTPKYWINIADRSIPFVGVIEHTNLLPPSMYGNNHIVYFSNYLGKDNPLYGATKEQLLEAYLQHIVKLNPAFDRGLIREYYYHR